MCLIYGHFYACLGLRFLDVETNPGPGFLFLVSAEYSTVMCGGLSKNLNDLTVASSHYDLWMCSKTLVSDIGVTCRSYGFLDLVALSFCAGTGCIGPLEWLHMCEKIMRYFANTNISVIVVKWWYLGLDNTLDNHFDGTGCS